MSLSTRLQRGGSVRIAAQNTPAAKVNRASLLTTPFVMKITSRTAWQWAWTIWMLGTAVSFVILERAALRHNSHPTLSTTLRRTLGMHPRHKWGPVAMLLFSAAWTWLIVHLMHTPDDVFFGAEPPSSSECWVEVSPGLWYRIPRHRRLI